MKIDPAVILAGLMTLFVLYIICRIFIKPIKWLLRLILNCAVGCAAMLLINRIAAPLGISFAINPLTAMISGVLGAPGMVMTLVLQSIL